jgi:CRP-like cAMP-binding protein
MAAGTPTKSELKKNLRALQERLRERPLDLDARMRVARTYRLLQRADDAVSHYAAVARYLSLAGHPLQAIAVLKELLQVDPKHEETLLFLAKLYARTRAADTTNRGRVAVPIFDPADPASGGLQTLHDGIPATSTGIWRAISPVTPEDLAVVRPADEVSARIDETPEALEAEAEERIIEDEDVVEEREDATAVDLAGRRAEAALSGSVDFTSVPDASFGDDYEVLGQMSTGDVLLPQVPLFSSLSPEAFVHLSHAMIFLKAKSGDTIFEQGQPGDSCIVISRGRARVTRATAAGGTSADPVELMQLSEGDIAGVFALVFAQTRQASLTAVTDLEYFEIDRLAVDELVHKYPAMKVTLARFFRERLLLSLLASLPFFQTLEVRERQELVRRFQDRDYEPGDELFFEGAENDGLWVVLEGRVAVARDDDGRMDKRLELGPGDYVGSLARVDTAAADLGAVATTVTKAAVLPHKVFSELLERHKDIAGARERFLHAGIMVGEHVFAGNGTLTGHLVSVR